MSQIETALSKCNVLTFSWPKSVTDIWTSSCLISEETAFSSGKLLGQKYFDWLSQGRKWRVSAGEGTAEDFCLSFLLSPTPSISGSVGQEWSWEWDMNSHTQPGTPSYRVTESYWPALLFPLLRDQPWQQPRDPLGLFRVSGKRNPGGLLLCWA